MIQEIEYDNKNSRVETGVVQFGNDWPGIFIRGDNAIYEGCNLQKILHKIENNEKIGAFDLSTLKYLSELLTSCNTTSLEQEEKDEKNN